MPRKGFWRSLVQPMAGLDPHSQYRELHWGNEPSGVVQVEVPGMRRCQDVVELGKLRKLYLRAPGKTVIIVARRPYPPLVVGAADNHLYLVKGHGARLIIPAAMPARGWEIERTDYDANKGGEEIYWFHEHESTLPRLRRVGRDVQFSGGSYVVAAEGIVG